MAMAASDFQWKKDCQIVCSEILPLARGVITPIVRMIIPSVKPYFSSQGKVCCSPSTLSNSSTTIAIVTGELLLTTPSAARPSSSREVISMYRRTPYLN
ncbi:hypothetical protein D3C73_1539630 [compost metagenome]